MLSDVKQQLVQSNQKYKAAVDTHRRQRLFDVGDLVMVRLRRERFPPGAYSKLARRKIGPIPITAKINDNAYTVALPPDCILHLLLTCRTFGLTHRPMTILSPARRS